MNEMLRRFYNTKMPWHSFWKHVLMALKTQSLIALHTCDSTLHILQYPRISPSGGRNPSAVSPFPMTAALPFCHGTLEARASIIHYVIYFFSNLTAFPEIIKSFLICFSVYSPDCIASAVSHLIKPGFLQIFIQRTVFYSRNIINLFCLNSLKKRIF